MKQVTILGTTLNAVVISTKLNHSQHYPRLHESCRYKPRKSNNAIHLCRLRMNLLHPSVYPRPGDGKR